MIKGNIQETFHKGVGIIVLDYAETDNWKLPEALIDTNFSISHIIHESVKIMYFSCLVILAVW